VGSLLLAYNWQNSAADTNCGGEILLAFMLLTLTVTQSAFASLLWKTNSLGLFLAANQRGLQHYLRTHYGDRTFEHLYRWNPFDIALLIPYFIVLLVLASYGIHRYVLVYMYYKNRKNRTTEPSNQFAELPRVTVQLPIFNEQFVIDRLVEAHGSAALEAARRMREASLQRGEGAPLATHRKE
jgi:hypothetical protein